MKKDCTCTGIRVKHKLTGIIVTTSLAVGYDSRYWEFLNYVFTEENEIK